MTYTKHRDTDDVLEVLDSLEIDGHDELLSNENLYRKFNIERDEFDMLQIKKWQRLQLETWKLFDEPYSSRSAKVRENI